MSTIYTMNGKVLKNSANDKWLIKAVPLDKVQIGDQVWKSKNLSIDDGGPGIYTHTVNYGQGDVVEYYYTWNAADRVANSTPGWHLPSIQEFGKLANAVGGTSTAGTKLKSTYGWDNDGNGTDDYGFSAMPAGYCDPNSGTLSNLGSYAYFWTSTLGSTPTWTALDRGFGADYAYMINGEHLKSYYAFTVRLIKDSE